jgi:hypothetical protein
MSATAASREERPGRGFGNERVREALVGYLFIAAPMILYGILFFYPIGYALYISRYDWGVLGKIDTVGFGNYRELFHDQRFGIAIKNGLKFTLAFTIFSMALGLFVAAVINNAIRFRPCRGDAGDEVTLEEDVEQHDRRDRDHAARHQLRHSVWYSETNEKMPTGSV